MIKSMALALGFRLSTCLVALVCCFVIGNENGVCFRVPELASILVMLLCWYLFQFLGCGASLLYLVRSFIIFLYTSRGVNYHFCYSLII